MRRRRRKKPKHKTKLKHFAPFYYPFFTTAFHTPSISHRTFNCLLSIVIQEKFHFISFVFRNSEYIPTCELIPWSSKMYKKYAKNIQMSESFKGNYQSYIIRVSKTITITIVDHQIVYVVYCYIVKQLISVPFFVPIFTMKLSS